MLKFGNRIRRHHSMTQKSKEKIWKFGSVIFIVVTACFQFGCEVSALEQSKGNSISNGADNKSQPLHFADTTLKSANTNAESNSSQLNNTTANNTANSEVNSSENSEINTLIAAATSSTPTNNQAKKSANDSQFDAAAVENSNLSKNIVWTFGGKAQTGWYIYKPLICYTIDADISAGDNDFAASLADWQRINGLPATGILETATLSAFVAKWQANRLKIRGYPAPNELLTAPTDDFYDVSRADELRQVERNTYAAYKRLIAAAIADKSLNLANNGRGELAASEQFLKIISAFRSREYQDKLRRESPNSGSAGLAVGSSPHFTGRALDIYVGGEPVTTKDANRAAQVNTIVYRWLVKNAGKFGFKPYFYEPWHWEYAPE